MANDGSEFFDTGLDYSRDDMSEAEWASLSEWYVRTHGVEGLDFVRFIPFMLANDAGALKHYRRWVETVPAGVGLGEAGIPSPAMGLHFLHLYTVIGYPEGVVYEVIASREWGATKAECQSAIAFGWLHGGPFGINTAARAAEEYLAGWDEQAAESKIQWPDGWARDPDAYRSGMDLSDAPLTDDDRRKLEAWHLEKEGSVPRYVGFLADHYPLALKAFRSRYERVTKGPLPAQMYALFTAHTAAVRGQTAAVQRAATHARHLGVTKAQLLHVLATTHVYVGDVGMDAVVDGLAPVLDGWTT